MTPASNSEQNCETECSFEMQGTVDSFDDGRGFGWIARDDGQKPDVFVHFTQIRGMEKKHRQLFPGWRVSFELGDAGRGPMALNVRVLDGQRA